MVEIDKRKVVRNQAIARLAKLIYKYFYNTDWGVIAEAFGVAHLLDQPKHERLRSAQHFGDDDYPSAITRFLKDVFDGDEQVGFIMAGEIVQQTSPDPFDPDKNVELTPEAKSELNQILSIFKNRGTDITLLQVGLPPAQDLAEVEKTPFLSQDDITNAHKMSELYIVLHCYENSVRRLIENIFENEYGGNWWDQVANTGMKNSVKVRKEKEKKERWLSPRGKTSPLYYLEWGDLVKLIRKEQDLFLPRVGSLRFVENRFEELESLRNIVAHNGVLPSDDDFQRVIISFRDWCRQIDGK